MPLTVNLRQLEAHNIVLAGKLPADELEIDTFDTVIQLAQPLEYDLEVQKLEGGLLVTGHLRLNLECQCVRCLKPFQHRLELDDWASHLPLQGDGCVTPVNGCVDLTHQVREDILLEFPWHPLCSPECRGLPGTLVGKSRNNDCAGKAGIEVSVWSKLNKLKL
jgi:uncharacterized metal-binding protein YceD (DUF177 family)